MHIQEKDERKTWMTDSVFWQLWGCYSISRDSRIREHIVCGMLPLVDYVIQRAVYLNYGIMEKEDIVSYGVLGLMEAIERYNPERNPNFTRYAYIRIQGAVYDGILRFRGLSRQYIRKRRYMQMQVDTMRQKLMRDPTLEEITACLGVGETEYQMMMNEEATLRILSLEDMEEQARHMQGMQTSDQYVEERVMGMKMQSAVQNAILQLPQMEQRIIYLHYYEGMTLREIGRRTGYSHAWITKNHKQAINHLKRMKIREFLEK